MRAKPRYSSTNESGEHCSYQHQSSPSPFCREEADKYEKLEALEAKNISVMAVEFSTMMEIIGFCENLTRENETVSNRIDSNVVNEEIGYWSLLRGIVPGMI